MMYLYNIKILQKYVCGIKSSAPWKESQVLVLTLCNINKFLQGTDKLSVSCSTTQGRGRSPISLLSTQKCKLIPLELGQSLWSFLIRYTWNFKLTSKVCSF